MKKAVEVEPINISDLSINLAEREKVIRHYVISVLDYRTVTYKRIKTPKAKKGRYNTTGHVFLTNKRLIYSIDNRSLPRLGLKCKDLHTQQIRVDDIQGIDFMASTMRKSLWPPIITFIVGVLTSTMGIGIPIAILSAIWLYIRHRNTESSMIFGVRAPSSNYSIFVSEMARGYGDTIQYWCSPTEDFGRMAKELGAIVLDLQQYDDDECFAKWSPHHLNNSDDVDD